MRKQPFTQSCNSLKSEPRNVLAHLHLCNSNETIHFNQIYEQLQPLEPKIQEKSQKTHVFRLHRNTPGAFIVDAQLCLALV